MRNNLLFLLLISILAAFGLNDISASPQIRDYQKNGVKVHHVVKNGLQVKSCTYCHSGTSIKQSPGQMQNYRKGQQNFNKLRNLPKCAGSGCHG